MISPTNLNAMRSAAAMADSDADIKTSMERLSFGSRVNSASDDAAGLAIATRMNTQIIGMAKAIDNAFDGANLMSTADGALDEVHSLLQRMRARCGPIRVMAPKLTTIDQRLTPSIK